MVNVSVEYYNNKEGELFKNYPNCSEINSLVNGLQTISKDELLAYMMFTEQKDHEGFKSYGELKERISNRLGDINDYLDFSNDTISARFTGNQMDNNLTERFGVGIGLSTIGKLHNLTEADWKRIPEVTGRNGHPTFDFDISLASDGNKFIQVENKGSAVENNTHKPSTIIQHYNSIKRKKEYLRSQNNSNLYYGTIGVMDNVPNHPVKLLLVDPPAEFIDFEPRKYKLIARLLYYLDEFRYAGVRSRILNALEERIVEIIQSQDYLSFDNKPLNYKLQGFYFPMHGERFVAIDTNEGFGQFFIIENKQKIFPYIIAYPKALMKLLYSQKFDDILAYSYDPDFIKEKVNVLLRIPKRSKIDFEIIEKLGFRLDERRGRFFEAIYYCNINHSLSGRLFGHLTNFKN